MLTKKPSVLFKKHTSDVELELIIKRVAEALGRDIVVHSGDRDHRPKGSPAHSLHLFHRALDFHVTGMSDGDVFHALMLYKGQIFSSVIHSYQVIHHGRFTATEGEHVHIGHYHHIHGFMKGPGVTFMEEGIAPGTKGKYHVVANG